ncbi:MAG TPA: CAAX prenyl protease-related protein [Capsulimonadaceae bacterium]|nr:CAAX prenyl protease-related protein [Capsulimonadaceae bacterium]
MKRTPAWLPYTAPLIVFLLLTQVEGRFGENLYPLLYTVKIALVASLLIGWRKAFPETKPRSAGVAIAIPLGILLCAAWVFIDQHTPHFAFLGTRQAYDPFAEIKNPAELWPFLLVRFAGLVAVVPVMEELFWRSFLLRIIIRPDDFEKVPIGTWDPASFAAVVVVMALAHPEWLAAAVFSAAMNLLLYRTKNLFACILCHGATNLCLGLYVLYSHAWQYW